MSKPEYNDKLTQVLEAIEHPERYTDEHLQQLLSDETCRDYYHLMCDAASAYADTHTVGDEETETVWQQMAIHRTSPVLTLRRIAAILLVVLMLSGIAYAAVRLIQNRHEVTVTTQIPDDVKTNVGATDRQEAPTDTVRVFQDAELQEILTEVSSHYRLRIAYHHDEARHIRFYVKWNKMEDVAPVMERLNMSEKVNIKLADDLLIVE